MAKWAKTKPSKGKSPLGGFPHPVMDGSNTNEALPVPAAKAKPIPQPSAMHPFRMKKRREYDPEKWSISNSTFKVYKEYKKGQECGIVFRERYICKDPIFEKDETEAMTLGKYFEAQCTGYNPENTQAGYYKSGPRQHQIKDEYLHAQKQAKAFKKMMQLYGLEIVDSGRFLNKQVEVQTSVGVREVSVTMLLDVVAKLPEDLKEMWDRLVNTVLMDGRLQSVDKPRKYEDCTYVDSNGIEHQGCMLIDLKFSALMDERSKWNDLAWYGDFLAEKPHKYQAWTYEALLNIPFFFYVANSKNMDVQFIRSITSPQMIQNHVHDLYSASMEIKKDMALNSFVANPSMSRCGACPIRESCESKIEVAPVVGVAFVPD